MAEEKQDEADTSTKEASRQEDGGVDANCGEGGGGCGASCFESWCPWPARMVKHFNEELYNPKDNLGFGGRYYHANRSNDDTVVRRDLTIGADTRYIRRSFAEGGCFPYGCYFFLKIATALIMTIMLLYSMCNWNAGPPQFTQHGDDDPSMDPDAAPKHHQHRLRYWCLKLGHWVLVVQFMYLWVSVYTARTLIYFHGEHQLIPLSVATEGTLHAIALPGATFVTLLYWTVIYNGNVVHATFMSHGLNFIIQIFDTCNSRVPYRACQFVYILIFLFAYMAFTLLYYAGGGLNADGKNYIYGAFDWNSALAEDNNWADWQDSPITLCVVMFFLMLPLVHIACWVLVYVRDGCIQKEAELGIDELKLGAGTRRMWWAIEDRMRYSNRQHSPRRGGTSTPRGGTTAAL